MLYANPRCIEEMGQVLTEATVVLGEIFNFAAYAFAPAILVTPLGALAVLIGAVLGSYFLNEELGVLGRLGSAICLIGAVIIVLHAPPDEDIKTIDQILNYAIQPGMFGASLEGYHLFLTVALRFLALLRHCLHIRRCHDLQGLAEIWQEEPLGLPEHLLDCGLGFGHGHQSLWYRGKVDLCGPQPVHPPVHLCIHDYHHCLHSDPDELLQ